MPLCCTVYKVHGLNNFNFKYQQYYLVVWYSLKWASLIHNATSHVSHTVLTFAWRKLTMLLALNSVWPVTLTCQKNVIINFLFGFPIMAGWCCRYLVHVSVGLYCWTQKVEQWLIFILVCDTKNSPSSPHNYTQYVGEMSPSPLFTLEFYPVCSHCSIN